MSIKLIFFMLIVLWDSAVQDALAESGDEEEGSADASKRDLPSFGKLIARATRRNPLDYNGYGCYCGFGGKGRPVDKLDRCCKVHDECYNKLQKSKLCPFEYAVYLLKYSYRKGKCRPASYYWWRGKCRHRLCKCDADAARCFAESPYHHKYKNYPRKKCRGGRRGR